MEQQPKQPPLGVLFDMDGTLLLTTQRAEQTWLHIFEQFEPLHHLAPTLLYQVMHEVYTTYTLAIVNNDRMQRRDRLQPFEVRQELVDHVLACVGITNAALVIPMVQAYEMQREHTRCLAPSALETLGQLRKQGIRLGLLTNDNATYQRRELEQHHLTAFFDCILIEEEFRVGKPDPRIYQEALGQLQIPAHETWIIGDNLWFDVGAPQQLGLFACWFDPDLQGLPHQTQVHPDCIIHTLTALLDEIAPNTLC